MAQPYITRLTFSNSGVTTLSALRSHTLGEFKSNLSYLYKPNLFVLPISSVQWRRLTRPHAKLQGLSSRVEARAWTAHKHSWIWRYLRQHRGQKEGSQYVHHPSGDAGGTATIDSWQLMIRNLYFRLEANWALSQPIGESHSHVWEDVEIFKITATLSSAMAAWTEKTKEIITYPLMDLYMKWRLIKTMTEFIL